MSRSGEITLPWGDAERTFRLGIAEWEKVEEKCGVGPPEILNRLAPLFAATEADLSLHQALISGYAGTWRVHDVREPLYQGLIGGGLKPTEAGRIVRQLVDERELIESVCLAYQVVRASLIGPPEEPLGEPEGEAAAADPSLSQTGEPATPTPTPTGP